MGRSGTGSYKGVAMQQGVDARFHEPVWSVVDRQSEHTHVVRVENAMRESNALPLCRKVQRRLKNTSVPLDESVPWNGTEQGTRCMVTRRAHPQPSTTQTRPT